MATDQSSFGVRLREAGITQIGVGSEVSGTRGTGYTNPTLGARDAHDLPTSVTRTKTTLSSLGQNTPETTAHGTSYYNDNLGAISPITGTGGTTITTYYKLRARDSACGSPTYVEWVTTVTPLTVASYGGALPCGGPLVDLTVLSIRTS